MNNEFLVSLRFSLSFLSNLIATASAALPFGQRIMGTFPNVTHTANNPSTTCERSVSISVSVNSEEGPWNSVVNGTLTDPFALVRDITHIIVLKILH